ncbi:MAG: hypothetical protein ACLSHM_01520 [Vescimonas sp.]
MDAQEAIRRMKGIHCGPKPTSPVPGPDGHALEEALAQAAKRHDHGDLFNCTIT